MRRLLTVAAVTLGLLVAGSGAAEAKVSDSKTNEHLVHRYGCSTSPARIRLALHPGGWLVVDDLTDTRWSHVEGDDFPTYWSLLADGLHPQAVCKR